MSRENLDNLLDIRGAIMRKARSALSFFDTVQLAFGIVIFEVIRSVISVEEIESPGLTRAGHKNGHHEGRGFCRSSRGSHNRLNFV
jgi:hypothetical protein